MTARIFRMPEDARPAGGVLPGGDMSLGNGYFVVRSSEAHLRAVLADLRPKDWREAAFFEAVQKRPRPVRAVLEDSFTRSLARFALLRGEICLAVGGVTPLPEPGWGCPWMVGTVELDASPRAFALLAKVFAPRASAVFPKLVNCTLEEKGPGGKAALAWLERCGFALRRPVRVPRLCAGNAKGYAAAEENPWDRVWVFFRAPGM